MATVHTAYGPGEIVGTSTVRGRTEYRVAGNGFDVWVDEAKLGGTRIADAWGASPGDDLSASGGNPPGYYDPRGQVHEPGNFGGYDNHPDDPVTPFSHLGDEDPNAHDDPFEGSRAMEHYQEQPHSFGRDVDQPYGLDDYGQYEHDYNQGSPVDEAGNPLHQGHRQAWAPVDHDNSVALPYDPSPQYPAIPGDTESTLQPIHQIDADERLSPSDSITFDHRGDDESELESTGPNFADRQAAFGGYPSHGGMEADWEDAYPDPSHELHHGPEGYDPHAEAQTDGYDYSTEGGPGGDNFQVPPHPDDLNNYDPPAPEWEGDNMPGHFMGSTHEAILPAILIPIAEGLAGAGGAGAAAGGVARGVGMGAASEMMGGGGGEEGQQEDPGMADQAVQMLSPGEGWGELQRGASLDDWLDGQDRGTGRAAGLDDRYIDITADVDYYNDPVAQFRHDPIAYIARTGHVHDEPISPEMAHYGQLIETNAMMRESAWRDVRAKAMRLRREGRVHVKDVDADRIYASVQGDHGTYDTMIVKGGAFGGFGGGHSITNWRCSCEWGRWAFKRQMTYVGRLCSHGYASYMEMQSAHTKGQPRQKRLTRPYTKRADALQNVPQRLVPELVINDSEDAQQFLDVEKDERTDTGPDDVAQDADIVHFARVLTACDQNQWPYPRELVAFLNRYAEDQTEADWKIEDTGKAGPALNEIRDWADTPQPEDYGHMDERNDDVRDAIDTARENGVDASQVVAFRTAAPGDSTYDPAGNRIDPNEDGPGPGTYDPTTGRDRPDPNAGPGFFEPGGRAGVGMEYDPATGRDRPSATQTGSPGQDVSPTRAENRTGPGGAGSGVVSTPGGNAPSQGIDRTAPGGPGAKNRDDPALPGGQNYNSTDNGAPAGQGNNAKPGGQSNDWTQNSDKSQIGQGEYKIEQGDTLADIAQRAGYGDDYQSLGDANGIKDYDMINAGGTLNIGKPGGGAKGVDSGVANPDTGVVGADSGDSLQEMGEALASPNKDNPTGPGTPAGGVDGTPAPAAPPTGPGGPVDQDSGPSALSPTPAPGAPVTPSGEAAPVQTPAVTPPAAPAAPVTPPVDVNLSAATPSGGGSGGASNTPAVTPPAAADPASPPANPPAGGGAGGLGQIGDIAGQVSDIAGQFSGLLGSRSIFADQADYDDWHRFAYPDAKFHDHQPFNGSGDPGPLEIGTSEAYADKARKKADDVTDLDYDVTKAVNPKQGSTGGGIRRAGSGPSRHVEPTVVRQQKVNGGRQTVEAHLPDYADFDPLAPKTAASFDDPYAEAQADAAAVHMAASGGDIVAQFQRSAGAQAVMGNGSSAVDNFDIAGAANQFLQRTAGRNYSLAEQHELVREGDIGGAGNLGSLQLAGTHYEDESKNSVGLW